MSSPAAAAWLEAQPLPAPLADGSSSSGIGGAGSFAALTSGSSSSSSGSDETVTSSADMFEELSNNAVELTATCSRSFGEEEQHPGATTSRPGKARSRG